MRETMKNLIKKTITSICIIYTIVAYTVGWIGGTSSILHGIIAAIFQIALAFIIWGGFMLHYRNDVRKMNEKIKEL